VAPPRTTVCRFNAPDCYQTLDLKAGQTITLFQPIPIVYLVYHDWFLFRRPKKEFDRLYNLYEARPIAFASQTIKADKVDFTCCFLRALPSKYLAVYLQIVGSLAITSQPIRFPENVSRLLSNKNFVCLE